MKKRIANIYRIRKINKEKESINCIEMRLKTVTEEMLILREISNNLKHENGYFDAPWSEMDDYILTGIQGQEETYKEHRGPFCKELGWALRLLEVYEIEGFINYALERKEEEFKKYRARLLSAKKLAAGL